MTYSDSAFANLRVKAVGNTISGKKPRKLPKPGTTDGDGDGRCQERGGRWVPCPPSAKPGSLLVTAGGRTVADLARGGGLDRSKDLPNAYRASMANRMATLGLTRRGLRDQSRKALAEADEDLVKTARDWYANVNRKTGELVDKINDRHGTAYSMEQGAAVMAALSPAREFGKNVRDGRTLMVTHAADREFELDDALVGKLKGDAKVAAFDAFMERHKNKTTFKPSDFNDDELHLLVALHPELSKLGNTTGLVNVVRASAVLRSTNVDDAMSGPKMRSFYSNIVDPEGDRVTIDTWMYRAMVNPKKKFTIGDNTGTLAELEAIKNNKGNKLMKVQNIFQGSPGAIKGSGVPANVGLYPEFADAIRDVAAENDLAPAALQAVIWEVARIRAGYRPTKWAEIEKAFEL